MSHSKETVLGRLARKWRGWSRRRRTMMALDGCGSAETTRMAHDIGVSEKDFRALAGRWPGSSELLSQRMHQLNLDASEMTPVEPAVAQDLQRVCSLCASQRRCRHDFASDPSAPGWRAYCPNAPTFAALMCERSNEAKRVSSNGTNTSNIR
jgi:hypothetical protein